MARGGPGGEQLAVQVRALLLALKSWALNEYGKDSSVLSDFGIVVPARKTPTAKVKAVAVDKNAETRVKRGTMGPRQRAKIEAVAVPVTAATLPGTTTKA